VSYVQFLVHFDSRVTMHPSMCSRAMNVKEFDKSGRFAWLLGKGDLTFAR
jgi:hypothetical protein